MKHAESLTPDLEGQVEVARNGRVLVAVPCFNEEATIGEVVRLARKHAEEVLVIDDGSTDLTAEVATFAGATVIRNPGNKGKGYGIRRAFEYAYDGDFDAVVTMDGDLQHDPEEIPLLLASLLRSDSPVDVSLGFRFGAATQMPGWRRIGKRVLDYATSFAGGGKVTDSQCGFRAFGRRAVEPMAERLIGHGFSLESEQLIIAHDAALKVENVNISCRYDGLDGSTLNPFHHATGVLIALLKLAARRHAARMIATASILLGIAGVLTIALDQSSGLAAVSATTLLLSAVGISAAVTLKILEAHTQKKRVTRGRTAQARQL